MNVYWAGILPSAQGLSAEKKCWMHAHVVSVVHGCCRHLYCPPASPKLQKGGGAQRYHFLTEPKLYNKLWCTFTGLKLCATHVWTVVPQSLSSASRTAAIRPSRFFEGLFRDRDWYLHHVRTFIPHVHARATADPYSTYLSACLQTDFCKNPAAWELHHTCSTLRSNFYRT